MANDDQVSARGGLRPSTQPYGNVKRSYYKLTTSASAVFIGQPMDLDGNGNAVLVSGTTAAATKLVGPVIGFARDSRGQHGLPDAMSLITQGAYLPALTNAYVCIADDPNQEFIMQEASTSTALSSANIGNSIGFVYKERTVAGSGDTVTGSSYAEIHPGLAINTTVGCLVLLGLADNMNSDGTFNDYGAYAKWRVRILNHRNLTTESVGIQ